MPGQIGLYLRAGVKTDPRENDSLLAFICGVYGSGEVVVVFPQLVKDHLLTLTVAKRILDGVFDAEVEYGCIHGSAHLRG
ncbi:hypothetical protein R1flu_027631 [Riccia fluitans]|uniref:Uncharacterized protein n=1 Tax=Riccia fluitans TaxID=41844 RepID=A0ABD1XNE5_9MARC